MRARLPTFAAALGLATLAARPAAAYCRTTTCDAATMDCTPDPQTGCVKNGKPLYWPGACPGYSVQENASRRVTLADATRIVELAFTTWTQPACPNDGRTPGIKLTDLGPIACDKHEYNQDAGNANVIMFRDEAWPYAGSANTLALTTVTYNVQTGEIYDADMEINGTVQLSIGNPVHYDLQSIVTHEAGHFIGLAHSTDPHATMYARYNEGTTSLRQLGSDDVAGVCAVYPPPAPQTCDTTPRHGFSSECATEATGGSKGCCATSPGRSASGGGAALAAAIAAVAAAAKRRRRRAA